MASEQGTRDSGGGAHRSPSQRGRSYLRLFTILGMVGGVLLILVSGGVLARQWYRDWNEDQAWQRAVEADSPYSYAEFIEKYPYSVRAVEAQESHWLAAKRLAYRWEAKCGYQVSPADGVRIGHDKGLLHGVVVSGGPMLWSPSGGLNYACLEVPGSKNVTIEPLIEPIQYAGLAFDPQKGVTVAVVDIRNDHIVELRRPVFRALLDAQGNTWAPIQTYDPEDGEPIWVLIPGG